MKNQPNKATVKDGLPIAEEVLKSKVPSALYNSGNCYVGHALDAMQEYSDQQNAELLTKIAQLENSYAKFAKERAEQYGEYIDLNVSLRNENAELRSTIEDRNALIKLQVDLGVKTQQELDTALERVKELESLLAKYREALEDVGIALRNEGFVNSTGEGVGEAARIVREALKQE